MSWTIQFDDTFIRANGAVGNGWTDTNAKWTISSNTLVGNGSYGADFLDRPSGESLTDQQVQLLVTLSANNSPLIWIRKSAGTGNGYVAWMGGGGLSIGKMVSGSLTILTSGSGAPANNSNCVIVFNAVGTTLTVTIALQSSPGTIVGTLTTTDSTYTSGTQGLTPLAGPDVCQEFTSYTAVSGATVSFAGVPVTTGALTVTSGVAGAMVSFAGVPVTTGALAVTAVAPPVMGALNVSLNSPTGITVAWSAATGGSGTKTYALYRNPITPFTPPGTGTLVGSTTGLFLQDTSPGVQDVFYRVIVTDLFGTSISVQTAFQLALCARRHLTSIVLGFVGDSITANGAPINAVASLAPTELPLRSVTLGASGNQGVSGTTSGDWVSGSGNLTTALAAFAANGTTHVLIMLGTNDAKAAVATSSSTYLSNIASTVGALRAAGYLVILNAPLWVVPGSYSQWDETAPNRLIGYRDILTTIINGGTVLLGDIQGFDFFQENAVQLTDGVHPDSTGNTSLGILWANAFERAMIQSVNGGPVGGRIMGEL